MSFQVRDPEFRRKVIDSFHQQAFMRTLGARLVSVEPGFCEIELAFRNDLCQQHGFIHGGITGTLADNAAGYAAFSLMPAGSMPLTVEYKINLLAPARGNRFVGRAQVEKSGRTLSTARTEVLAYGGSGESTTIAVGLVTIMCLAGRDDRITETARTSGETGECR